MMTLGARLTKTHQGLAETGLAIEMRAIREGSVEEFSKRLRALAAREQQLFYPWSSSAQPPADPAIAATH